MRFNVEFCSSWNEVVERDIADLLILRIWELSFFSCVVRYANPEFVLFFSWPPLGPESTLDFSGTRRPVKSLPFGHIVA